MNSKIFDLNLREFFRGLIVSMMAGSFTIVVTAFQSAVETGVLLIDWNVVIYAAIFSGLSFIVHQFGADENGKFLGAV